MAEKQDYYTVEISDIYESDQEDLVIEQVKGYLKKDYNELKEYFKETDSLQVKKLSKEEAEQLQEQLKSIEVKVTLSSGKGKRSKEKKPEIRCPKCGCKLEYQDWRCPECYYEFPDYEYVGEGEEKPES